MAVNLPEVLDGSMNPVRILHPSEASANLSVLSVSSADVKILISEEIKLGDWVRMYYPNGKSGVFRAGNPTYDYISGTQDARLMHGCSTLADDIVTEGYKEDSKGQTITEYFSGSAKDVLTRLLGYQKTKHWKVGTVQPTDSVKIEVKYQEILTLINDMMDLLPGCYVDYDQTSYPWKVNILKKPTEVTSEGRLSRNVSSAQVSYDDSELITRLYCNALPGGHIDSKNISKYGLREGFYYVDKNIESDWISKACNTYLKNRENPDITVTIDGADFSKITGVSLDKIVLAELYRLALPKYKVTVEEQIVELSYYDIYNRPNECKITLGSHRQDLSSTLAKTKKTANRASRGVSATASNVNAAWQRFVGEVEGLNTLISQTEDRILLQANDMIQGLQSEFSMTAEQIRSSVRELEGGMSSFIEQTASRIQMQVNDSINGLQSAITVTAGAINMRVDDLQNDMGSAINLNREQIELRVRKGDVATALVVELNNVSIKNGNLVVDGYVTSSGLYSSIAALKTVMITKLQANAISVVDRQGRESAVATETYVKGCIWSLTAANKHDDQSGQDYVELKFRQLGDSDYHTVTFSKPSIDPGDTFAAGWAGYYNSNLWESPRANPDVSSFPCRRPRSSSTSSTSEVWFNMRMPAGTWDVEPDSSRISASNIFHYTMQKSEGGTVSDILSRNLLLFVTQDNPGEDVFLRVTNSKGKKIARLTPKENPPTIGTPSITAAYPYGDQEALSAAKVKMTVRINVNGSDKSWTVATGNSFSVGRVMVAREGYKHVMLRYGGTAIADLKIPE